MKRKICVITGTRADYGILSPVMKAIKKSKEFELQVIATAMHLMREFGNTAKEIEKDGFKLDAKLDVFYSEDSGRAMAISVGKTVSKMAGAFSRLKPDIVLVLGDRGEMLAAAIAGDYLNIPVAHIHGGEISGHVDGLFRHAITKLSHLHFPATAAAKRRLIRLGEDDRNIFVSGAPALDQIFNDQTMNRRALIKKYRIDSHSPLALVVQHPVNTEMGIAAKQIRATLQAIKDLNPQTLLIYPNADAGGRAMIREIKKWEKLPNLRTFKSIPHRDFLGLMKIASVLIGNSSSGIIEAPSFKLPVVNIGIRQKGRERGGNVIDVPHDGSAIIRAINKSLYDKKFLNKVKQSKNPYGDGHASQRIVNVLSTIKLGPQLLQKQIAY
jgi:UDP-N-acetylglucosamine 2-epimerase (non-hydrolysing)/GDP/UDP-N,N'-diacetylbacillosamine 2-epimerase (hydrolysing)